VHPARQPGGGAGIGQAERAAGVGAIGVHRGYPATGRTRRKSAWIGRLVKKPTGGGRGSAVRAAVQYQFRVKAPSRIW
jgi:hypothetical protein